MSEKPTNITWELAKSTLDGMREPYGEFNCLLAQINGFECTMNLYKNKTLKIVTLWNADDRTSYSKTFNRTPHVQVATRVFEK